MFKMFLTVFRTHSPGVVAVEQTPPCDGRCLRCGLPIRSATLPPPARYSTRTPPRLTDHIATGSRSCDVTSGPRDSGKCATLDGDVAVKKRVRFAPPPTDDVTDDVRRQLVPVTPSPLSGSSFITMQTARSICPSQLAPSSKLTTFVGTPRDASIV